MTGLRQSPEARWESYGKARKICRAWLRRPIACCLAMLLVAPFGAAAATPPQSSLPGQQPQATPPQQNSAGAAAGQSAATTQPGSVPENSRSVPENPGPARTQGNDAQLTGSGAQSSSSQPQQKTPPAVGTAAAPYQKTMGVPASRPAGVVIAPAKQKRTRSFLIRIGLIVGGAVAIGAVIGLTRASPSRPQ